ncbi:MAG: amidohydrolase [Planctomycetia bacterium]|nr:amidohydrolase [Planctomycetia bacterium]
MSPTPEQTVSRCQAVMAHAWMVRTFIKHAPEAEEFPELMEIVRTVFDVSRALEAHAGDPAAYLHTLRKKIGKLRAAADKFRHDAPLASSHTNFQQAVISIDTCVADLAELLDGGSTSTG